MVRKFFSKLSKCQSSEMRIAGCAFERVYMHRKEEELRERSVEEVSGVPVRHKRGMRFQRQRSKSASPLDGVDIVPPAPATACTLCFGKFSLMRRRHHCRSCAAVVCAACSPNKLLLEGGIRRRACTQCYAHGATPAGLVSVRVELWDLNLDLFDKVRRANS
jgi:hypothetical protein